MFIELAEYVECPGKHESTFLVLATGAMRDRAIHYGTLGCPVCRREFLIVQQVVKFGPPPALVTPAGPLPEANALQAVLGLESPGGYVVLAGSAARGAELLADRLSGVHLVCLNATGVPPAQGRSLLEATATIPLRAAVVRGVVLGAEYAEPAWLAEAARVTLRGQRVVALAETIQPPEGLERLAAGQGMWVGRKR
jgi:hypothetical protein